MKDYMGVTDTSISTETRYALIAEHQVRAYSEAYRKHMDRERGTDFLLSLLGKLVWYCMLKPILLVLKVIIIWVVTSIQRYIKKRIQNNTSSLTESSIQ